MSQNIQIIDCGLGNIGSVKNIIKKAGYIPRLVTHPDQLHPGEKIILPGVGAFDGMMSTLENRGFIPLLNQLVLDHKEKILGVCLGMQVMTNSSEEGKEKGLGWIQAECKKFIPETSEKIPHMGWNYTKTKKKNPLMKNLETAKFYFVHSYYVKCHEKENTLCETFYIDNFTSAFNRDNIFGVQFHPEKSHRFGLQLIKNFCAI